MLLPGMIRSRDRVSEKYKYQFKKVMKLIYSLQWNLIHFNLMVSAAKFDSHMKQPNIFFNFTQETLSVLVIYFIGHIKS
jgi:sulfatase maturation enzyme AslB (radical SAM superfamily)